MNEIRKLSWAGGLPAKNTRGITQNHRPLIFECMLGTVNAVEPDGKVTYCDYDYAKARKLVQEDKYTDIRVCKAPRNFNFPGSHASVRKGRACVFGIPLK